MKETCIFCKIAAGEIPADKVYEDEEVVAFHDLQPQAPVHVLLIPKKHLTSMEEVGLEDQPLLGHLLGRVPLIARQLGLGDGYRLVINTGRDGLQTVPHLHVHLLGKRAMQWPPG